MWVLTPDALAHRPIAAGARVATASGVTAALCDRCSASLAGQSLLQNFSDIVVKTLPFLESCEGKPLVQPGTQPQIELPGVPLSRQSFRKLLVFCLGSVHPLVDDSAQLGKNLPLVSTVNPAQHKLRAPAYVAAVLFGPFDNPDVAI